MSDPGPSPPSPELEHLVALGLFSNVAAELAIAYREAYWTHFQHEAAVDADYKRRIGVRTDADGGGLVGELQYDPDLYWNMRDAEVALLRAARGPAPAALQALYEEHGDE